MLQLQFLTFQLYWRCPHWNGGELFNERPEVDEEGCVFHSEFYVISSLFSKMSDYVCSPGTACHFTNNSLGQNKCIGPFFPPIFFCHFLTFASFFWKLLQFSTQICVISLMWLLKFIFHKFLLLVSQIRTKKVQKYGPSGNWTQGWNFIKIHPLLLFLNSLIAHLCPRFW